MKTTHTHQELIRAGACVNLCNTSGSSPLAVAMNYHHSLCAELLLDAGAKVTSAIPDWMKGIVAKRQSVKQGLLAFLGVLRKRFGVGWLPRDLVGLLGRWVWSTRLDARWMLAVHEMKKVKQ